MINEIEIRAQNARGLRTKQTEFVNNFLNTSAHMIFLTETWFNDSFSCSEYILSNFVSHRRDRNYFRTKTTRGGGCWIIHKPELKSVRLLDFELDIDFLEDLWIRLVFPNFSLF